jgi:hypothetical protein
VAKLTRKLQKIFAGGIVAPNNIAEFGSLKAGLAAYSTDPDEIQTDEWLLGWAGATVNNNAPALQDMNALAFLITRQLAYLFESGVPEWDATTTYYVGNIVSDGAGNLYRSVANSNLNNIVTLTDYWLKANSEGPGSIPVGSVIATFPNLTGAYECAATTIADANGFVKCNGQKLADALSPMNGDVIPNINNSVFLMGSTTAGSIGGANTINFAHTHSLSVTASFPDHNHNLSSSHAGATVHISTNFIWMDAAGPVYTLNSRYNPPGGGVVAPVGTNGAGLYGRTENSNSTPTITSTGTSGVNLTTTDIRPKYISAVYLMRVR